MENYDQIEKYNFGSNLFYPMAYRPNLTGFQNLSGLISGKR